VKANNAKRKAFEEEQLCKKKEAFSEHVKSWHEQIAGIAREQQTLQAEVEATIESDLKSVALGGA